MIVCQVGKTTEIGAADSAQIESAEATFLAGKSDTVREAHSLPKGHTVGEADSVREAHSVPKGHTVGEADVIPSMDAGLFTRTVGFARQCALPTHCAAKRDSSRLEPADCALRAHCALRTHSVGFADSVPYGHTVRFAHSVGFADSVSLCDTQHALHTLSASPTVCPLGTRCASRTSVILGDTVLSSVVQSALRANIKIC